MPLALSDSGLRIVMTAAAGLPPEKRSTFMERIAALLGQIRRPSDADIRRAVHAALRGVMQSPAA